MKWTLNMGEALGDIAHWLSLVAPAVTLTALLLSLMQSWLLRSFWHFGGAFFGGLIVIALLFAAITMGIEMIVSGQIEQCRAQAGAFGCGEQQYFIGYPVIIGLISFGFYLVSTLMVGLYHLIRGRRVVAS